MLILSSLAGGAKHGYALVKDVESFADTHIAPGTLYETLARLQTENLIEPIECDDRRRPYRLTAHGKIVLSEHLQTQRRIADVGIRRLRQAWRIA
jgi:DNA-binding PadR family transcriptional regulator